MALGVYKPGQGYWVRVLTAVAAGTIVLATAMWLWGQVDTVGLPKSTWEVTYENASGSFDAGDSVVFEAFDAEDPTSRRVIGSASVVSASAGSGGSGELIVGSISMLAKDANKPDSKLRFTVAETEYIVASDDLGGAGAGLGAGLGADLGDGLVGGLVEGLDDASGASGPAPTLGGDAASARAVSAIGIEDIPRLYINAGTASVVILFGAFGILYFVGSSKPSAEFLIATDGEMKKVNWSTRREVLGSTGVVIFAAFLIAALLYGVDIAFNQFFGIFGLHG
ncbi:MAG: preprotein translocase subunit SecE [Planctomycetota bacterium]